MLLNEQIKICAPRALFARAGLRCESRGLALRCRAGRGAFVAVVVWIDRARSDGRGGRRLNDGANKLRLHRWCRRLRGDLRCWYLQRKSLQFQTIKCVGNIHKCDMGVMKITLSDNRLIGLRDG